MESKTNRTTSPEGTAEAIHAQILSPQQKILRRIDPIGLAKPFGLELVFNSKLIKITTDEEVVNRADFTHCADRLWMILFL